MRSLAAMPTPPTHEPHAVASLRWNPPARLLRQHVSCVTVHSLESKLPEGVSIGVEAYQGSCGGAGLGEF